MTRAHFARACMGGWCALRDHCPHYHASFRGEPAERLCPPGRDGLSEVVQLDLRPATVFPIHSQTLEAV
jgi:hypothetical protein